MPQPMFKKRESSARPVRPPPNERPKNQLLAALPPEDFRLLRGHLETVPLRLKQVLYEGGDTLRAVYFLNGGFASISTTLPEGTVMGAATVGDEGVLGIEAFLGPNAVAPGDAQMQMLDSSAEMLGVDTFRRELAKRGALHHLIGRYAQVFIAQLMQTTACNAKHQVPQRCARKLLMTHDRMHRQDFTLSHEFLAVMLGVQRPTVSTVAATLQEAGFIRYTHGRITILDRKGLERMSCGCYAIIRAHFDRLRQ
jgi:CRP-like cAMP-binding protein